MKEFTKCLKEQRKNDLNKLRTNWTKFERLGEEMAKTVSESNRNLLLNKWELYLLNATTKAQKDIVEDVITRIKKAHMILP